MKQKNIAEILAGSKCVTENGVYKNARSSNCIYKDATMDSTCNRPLERAEGIAILTRYGIRYVCNECYRRQLGYHGGRSFQQDILGTQKNGSLEKTTVGCEVEYMFNNLTKNEIATAKWLLNNTLGGADEADCTVSSEHPTGIMLGLGRISKVLQGLEHYICSNGKTLLSNMCDNSQCGAHCHGYCNDVVYVRRYYHSIFIPLYDRIAGLDNDRMQEVFGSNFRGYASRIYAGCNPQSHSNFVNTQHAKTLELRLPRIVSHKQYIKVLKFWRECCYTINTWDFEKENIDNDIRTANAKACGAELVNVFNKYFV